MHEIEGETTRDTKEPTSGQPRKNARLGDAGGETLPDVVPLGSSCSHETESSRVTFMHRCTRGLPMRAAAGITVIIIIIVVTRVMTKRIVAWSRAVWPIPLQGRIVVRKSWLMTTPLRTVEATAVCAVMANKAIEIGHGRRVCGDKVKEEVGPDETAFSRIPNHQTLPLQRSKVVEAGEEEGIYVLRLLRAAYHRAW